MISSIVFAAMIGSSIGNPAACQNDPVQGNGDAQVEERPLSGFSRVESNLPIPVEVTQGTAYSVLVTADTNVAPVIVAYVRGNTLYLEASRDFTADAHSRVAVVIPKQNPHAAKAQHAARRLACGPATANRG